MAPSAHEQSQAPNTKCKKCNLVPVTGLKCVKCKSVMHPGCIKYLKNIKEIDENTILCCESLDEKTKVNMADLDSSSDSITTVIENNMEVEYLKKLLTEKDNAINYLKDNIIALNEQIKMLNVLVNLQNPGVNQNHLCTHPPSMNEYPNKNKTKYNDTTKAVNNSEKKTKTKNVNKTSNANTTKLTSSRENPITSAQVTTAILQTQTNNKMNELINLTKDDQKSSSANSKIIGSNTSENVAASEKLWLYVSKYKTTYTIDELNKFLQGKFPSNSFICKQVKNWGIYSSFRVAVDIELKENLLNPNFWPRGIEVSEYIFRTEPNGFWKYKNSKQ
ncbi:unnamed protein product [Brassicogethes aeneus]|uniref:Uncharacterized protein n=1 Tax=Brassicogethes aeneus TaxID=1431903 RepID=A0A9P0B1G9_BRAAE|nr:unnamed protein product [Brassicogethes aeneus]